MRRPAQQQLVPFAVILFAALLATLPLAVAGASCGHDLPFHLVNWIDAAHQWKGGTLRPWWSSAAAWNTGEARFLFYPPISWIAGALLTLLVGVARAPIAYTLLALAASGVTMRRFLSGYVSAPLALLGGCLYLAHPYMLFTATERTAYAELLAAAWFPLLLQQALRQRIHPARFAVPVSLLWLTNTPAGVLGTYTVAILLGVRCTIALRNDAPAIRPLLTQSALGYAWGVGLAALYLVPAIVQHSAVEVGQAFTAGMLPEEATLFAHTGEPFHDHVVHQASVLAVLLLAAAAAAAAVLYARGARLHRLHSMRDAATQQAHTVRVHTLRTALLTLTVLVAFLLTPASLFVWHHMPEMQFLQFPWRTLMLQGLLTTTLMVLALPARLPFRFGVPLALAAVALLSSTAHSRYAQACDAEDAPIHLQTQYVRGAGFEPYDEYTPKGADNDLLHAGEPAAWTAADPTAPATPQAAAHTEARPTRRPADLVVVVSPGASDRFVILRQRRFPHREVTLDSRPVITQPLRDDDLIAVALPDQNTHTFGVHSEWSADEYAGLAISAVAAMALAAWWRRP